jgi:hypothetical protein
LESGSNLNEQQWKENGIEIAIQGNQRGFKTEALWRTLTHEFIVTKNT